KDASPSTFTVASCRRAITGPGVCAGASRPYQVEASYPGTADSAMVGSSGSAGERFALVTAIATTLRDFTCAIAAGMVANYSCTWPESTSTIGGPAPL